MECLRCKSTNDEDSLYCVKCGEGLKEETAVKDYKKPCRGCGKSIKREDIYCPVCGTNNPAFNHKYYKYMFIPLIVTLGLFLLTTLLYCIKFDVGFGYGRVSAFSGTGIWAVYWLNIIGAIIFIALAAVMIISLQKNTQKKFLWASVQFVFPVLLILGSIFMIIGSILSSFFNSGKYYLDYWEGSFTFTVVDVMCVTHLFVSIAILALGMVWWGASLKTFDGIYPNHRMNRAKGQTAATYAYQRDSIPVLVFLSIITLGIYAIVWMEKTTRHLKTLEDDYSPNVGTVLLLIFIPFYRLYWFYKYTEKLQSHFKDTKHNGNFLSPIVTLAVLVPIVSLAALCDKMNLLYSKS